jgi:glycolate oxidase
MLLLNHIVALSAIVGPDLLITAQSQLQTYECDGPTNFRTMPAAVMLPPTAQEVQAVVRL